MMQVRSHCLAAAIAFFLAGSGFGADRASVEAVQARVKALLPNDFDQDPQTVEVFVARTCTALSGFDRFSDAEADLVARSIAEVAADLAASLGKQARAADFQARLSRLLDGRGKEFGKVRPKDLDRDWKALRGQFAEDRRAARGIVEDVLEQHPVLWIDPAPAAGAAGDSSQKNEPTTGESRRTPRDLPGLMEQVDGVLNDALGQTGEHLGNLFLPETLGYPGPLTDEQRAKVRAYASEWLVIDGVAVVDRGGLFGAIDAIRRYLLTRKSVESVDLMRRLAAVESLFDLAKAMQERGKLPKDWRPTVIRGDVPEDMLNGMRFRRPTSSGSPVQESAAKKLTDAKEIETLRHMLTIWSGRISENVERRDPIAGDLVAEFQSKWIDRILTLSDFGGMASDDEVELSALERRLLKLLRAARISSPLFVDANRPLDERYSEYRRWIIGSETLKKRGKGDWSKLNREEYLAVAAELQKWLDAEYEKRITPEMARAEQVNVRMTWLFESLTLEIMAALRRDANPPTAESVAPLNAVLGRVGAECYRAYEPLQKARLLRPHSPAAPKELAAATPVTKAFFAYFQAAAKHNPVLQKLDESWSYEQVFAVQKEHVAKGRTAEETAAHDAALRALEIAAGLRAPDPVAASESSFPDLVASPSPAPASQAAIESGATATIAAVATPDRTSSGGSWFGLLSAAAAAAAATLVIWCCRRIKTRSK